MARQKHTTGLTRATDDTIIIARGKAARGQKVTEPTLLPDSTSLETTINNIVVNTTGPITENVTSIESTVTELLERNVVQSAWIKLPRTRQGVTTLTGEFGEDAVGAPVLINAAPGDGHRFFDGLVPRYVAAIVNARTMRIGFQATEPPPSLAKIVYIIGTAEEE